jgi:hypothetical protein
MAEIDANADAATIRVEVTNDLRKLVATRGFGAAHMVILIQSRLVDMRGAYAAGQWSVAAGVGQQILQECNYVRAAFASGWLPGPHCVWDVGADPFNGLDDASLQLCMDNLHALGAATTRQEREAALQAVEDYYADAERSLGLTTPLPMIRQAEGLFPVLRLARKWSASLEKLGLPSFFPKEWLN